MGRVSNLKGKARLLLNRPYHYDPLPSGHFRYLLLQPGSEEDPLQCSLRTTTTSNAKYEALSYVWGSELKDQKILCDGRVLTITTNLHQALLRLRTTTAVRYLWVDSICINQADPEEKTYQVAIMGQIYKEAERVLIYIGQDPDSQGRIAKALLEDVRTMLNKELAKIDATQWDAMPYPQFHDPLLSDTRWSSFIALLQHDWFSRGWVVQEAALTREALIVWGTTEIPWDNVMWANMWIDSRASPINSSMFSSATIDLLIPHTDAYSDRHIDSLVVFYVDGGFRMTGLLDFLQCGRSLQFTDSRDRINAFLGLPLLPDDNLDIVPNYRHSTLDVYHDFALKYIGTKQTLRLLSYVMHSVHTLQSTLPTWVPHWDTVGSSSLRFSLGRYEHRAVLTSRLGEIYDPEIIGDSVLKVRGVFIDNIRFVSDIFDQATITPKSLYKLCTTVDAVTPDKPYSFGHFRAFFDALSICRSDGDWNSWVNLRDHFVDDFEYHEAGPDSFEWSGNQAHLISMHGLITFIARIISGQRFIVTERGYMGIAPGVTQEKDLCAILFGNQHQFILRAAKDKNASAYQLLGPAFILGDEMGPGGLGSEERKEWLDWDVEEQDIYLC